MKNFARGLSVGAFASWIVSVFLFDLKDIRGAGIGVLVLYIATMSVLIATDDDEKPETKAPIKEEAEYSTIRQDYKIAAMQGILACPGIKASYGTSYPEENKSFAIVCGTLADAMLAEDSAHEAAMSGKENEK